MTKKLSPKVQQFKSFVQKHPLLIKEVRQNKTTWQELFEEWYLLGEDDPKWLDYRIDQPEKAEKKSRIKKGKVTEKNEFVNQLLESVKKLDPEQIQKLAGQLSQALDIAIKFLNELKTPGSANTDNTKPALPRNPFAFRKD